MISSDALRWRARQRRVQQPGPLPYTCHGCGGRMEAVGCKRVVAPLEGGDPIWVCAACEPILLRAMAEEGMTFAVEGTAERVPRRDRRAAARAVKRAQRGRRPDA